ncbi:hypothetical protein EON65_40420 [archaeon]|nr:MAG: hypothetical protein EON65_40420 [archaeon]
MGCILCKCVALLSIIPAVYYHVALCCRGEVGASHIPSLYKDKNLFSAHSNGDRGLRQIIAFPQQDKKRKSASNCRDKENTPTIARYAWGLAFLADSQNSDV